jgi:hypothetical protein
MSSTEFRAWIGVSITLLLVSVITNIVWAITSASPPGVCTAIAIVNAEFESRMSFSIVAIITAVLDALMFGVSWWRYGSGEASTRLSPGTSRLQIGLITLFGAVALAYRAYSLHIYAPSLRSALEPCGSGTFYRDIAAWLPAVSLATFAVGALGMHTLPRTNSPNRLKSDALANEKTGLMNAARGFALPMDR